VEAAPHEPPRTLALRVKQQLGDAAHALVELLDTLDRQRYGREAVRRPDASLTRRFVSTARTLRRSR